MPKVMNLPEIEDVIPRHHSRSNSRRPSFFNHVDVHIDARPTTNNDQSKQDGCFTCFKALFKAFK